MLLRQPALLDILQGIVVAIPINLTQLSFSWWIQDVSCPSHVFSVYVHMHVPPVHFGKDAGFIPRAYLAIPAERRHSYRISRGGKWLVISETTIVPCLGKKIKQIKQRRLQRAIEFEGTFYDNCTNSRALNGYFFCQ